MAMNFEDLKDKVSETLRSSWERFQDTSVYHQGKDQYQNLSPLGQRLVLFGAIGLIFLLLASIPLSFFSPSMDRISEFERQRTLIRDLLKASRDSQSNPDIPVPPPVEAAKSQIDFILKGARLIPEQIVSIDTIDERSDVVPDSMKSGSLRVTLSKLNLRQIVDLGSKLQSINKSLKLKDLSIEANAQMPKYFDVVFKLIALNVPDVSVPPPEPVDEPKSTGKKKPSKGDNVE